MFLCALVSYWAKFIISERRVHVVSILMLLGIFLLLVIDIFSWWLFGFFFWWKFTWRAFFSTLCIWGGSIAIIRIPLFFFLTIKRPSIPPGFFPNFLQLVLMQLYRLFDLSIFEQIFLWLILGLCWLGQYSLCRFSL